MVENNYRKIPVTNSVTIAAFSIDPPHLICNAPYERPLHCAGQGGWISSIAFRRSRMRPLKYSPQGHRLDRGWPPTLASPRNGWAHACLLRPCPCRRGWPPYPPSTRARGCRCGGACRDENCTSPSPTIVVAAGGEPQVWIDNAPGRSKRGAKRRGQCASLASSSLRLDWSAGGCFCPSFSNSARCASSSRTQRCRSSCMTRANLSAVNSSPRQSRSS
jgi:hypothetical protein